VANETRLPVLFLISDLSSFGETAAALARSLPPDQFRVVLALLERAASDETKILVTEGISVKPVPIRHALDVVGTRRLKRLVHDTAPAILHAWGTAAVRAARSVVSRDGVAGNRPRLVISDASNVVGGLGGWAAARQMRRADRVIPTTRADGDRYRRLGVPAEQLTLVSPAPITGPGTPDRELVCRNLNVPSDVRLLVTGGKSERGGGPRDAIITFDMLRYDLKDLYLVVPSAGAELPALEKFARSLAFEDLRVRFPTGPTEREAAIRLAEVVLATRPLGGISDALEAMSAGKAVVGWNTPDLAEVVEDRVTGLLVPFGDRAALASATRTVLDNPAYGRRLGEAGRVRAAMHFAPARRVEQMVRLYHELASPNGCP
jgi:glycosyltransferase involved in cell wall biosynthesis